LPWKRWSDSIKDFVQRLAPPSRRHITAVFCAHDFAPTPFEQHLLPSLKRCGARTLVLCDRKALIRNLGHDKGRRLGAYELAPVVCTQSGVFHPKCFFLSAGNQHLVGVGSANLTHGGMGDNLELCFVTNDVAVVRGVAGFLLTLAESPHVRFRDSAKGFLREIAGYIGKKQSPHSPVLHSLQKPIFSQMWQSVGEQATRIHILSPWHSGGSKESDPKVVSAIRKIIGVSPKVTVFTNAVDCEGRYGPACGPGILSVRVLKRTTTKQSSGSTAEVDLGDYRPSQLHAKAYAFEKVTRKKSWFIGSANCTIPALFAPVSEGGNVEMVVHIPATEAGKLDSDLSRIFAEAKTKSTDPTKPESTPLGHVLDGAMIPGGILRLHAANPRDESQIEIAPIDLREKSSQQWVKVKFRRGVARLSRHQSRLLLSAMSIENSGTDDRRGFFLAEIVNGKPVSFPVTWTHRPRWENGEAEDAPTLIDGLEDLLASVSGWRSRSPGWQAADNDSTEDDDDDLRSWLTESKHAGELDRIAIVVARLKRAISKRGVYGHLLEGQVRTLIEKSASLAEIPANFLLRYLKSKGH
jgi:HKD family nuclease